MAPTRSVTVAVTSPRSCARARAWRRSRRTSTWSSSTRSGTEASVNSVSRSEIWLSTTSVTVTTTRFWNSETSEAVMTVLVWSTSVMMPEMSCPGAGPLEVAEIEREQVVEEPDAEVPHQPFLHRDRELAGGVAEQRS